jgi:flagellar biosynthesis GTPase FlhF
MNTKSESRTIEKQAQTVLVDAIPRDVLELLGPPPLLSTEDAKLYHAMLAHIAHSIRPEDLITWMLVKDLADHRVEIARYRRFKTGIIQAAGRKKIERALSEWRSEANSVAPHLRKKAEGEKEAAAKSNKTAAEIEQLKQEIDKKTEAEISGRETKAQSAIQFWSNKSSTEADFVDLFNEWVGSQERIDNLLRAAEERFSASLEELERHVCGLGRFIRERWDTIEGELIEPSAPDQPSSARPMPLDPTRTSSYHKATPGTAARRKSSARQGNRSLARGSR